MILFVGLLYTDPLCRLVNIYATDMLPFLSNSQTNQSTNALFFFY